MKTFKEFLTEETKFKGSFNWHGENIYLYTQSQSKEQAFHNFVSQLAKKLKRNVETVKTYFKNKGNSYSISEVK